MRRIVAGVAGEQAVEFSGQQWQFADRGAHVMPYMNRPSLFLDNGIAYVPGAAFADGVIEFDVAMHGSARFAGVVFRGQSARDYELIYLRTVSIARRQLSRLADAARCGVSGLEPR